MIDQNIGVEQNLVHPTMFGLIPLDPIPVPIEAIRLIAIGVWEIGSDAKRLIEYRSPLSHPCLLSCGAVGRKVFVQCGAYDLGQCATVARAQLLDLATLILGQIHLCAGGSDTAQYTAAAVGWS